MWRFEVLKKLGIQLTGENVDHIGEMVRECLASPVLRAGIRKAREEAWECMGESASRTADYLIEKCGGGFQEERSE